MHPFTKILLLAMALSLRTAKADEPASMKRAFQALMNLQVLAAPEDGLTTKKSRAIAELDFDKLFIVKHDFTKKDKARDPALAATLQAFMDHLTEARTELRNGNVAYARSLIRSSGSFCLGCHTRLPGGEFQDASRRVEAMNLSPFRKAEFFAASRQFDRAIEIYRKVLHEKPETGLDAVEFGRALRHYVLLEVRVKQDPDALAHNLEKLSKRKDLPDFVRALTEVWSADTAFWRDTDRIVTADLNAEALLRHGQRLIERGETFRTFPTDASGDVSFLRATGYLHEALGRGLVGAARGEALYLLAVGYQSLGEPAYAGLDQVFFEACIRENPRTAIARKCYRAYLRDLLRQGDLVSEANRQKAKRLGALLE